MGHGQHDHDDSQYYAIDDKQIQRVGTQESEKECDYCQSQNGGNADADNELRCHSRRESSGLHYGMCLEENCACGNWGQQQEAEARSSFAIEATGKSGCDCGTGARDTWNQCKCLRNTDENRIHCVDSSNRSLLASKLVGQPHENANDGEHAADEQVILTELQFGVLIEELAYDRPRDGSQHNPPQ